MTQELITAAQAPILAFNEVDWDAATAALAPTATYDEVATHRNIEGVESILETWKGWKTAFPDNRGEFHEIYSSGDKVVFEITWTGTHNGPLALETGMVPATGRSFAVRACMIMRIEDGKVATCVHYFDMATLLQQLGLEQPART